MLRWCGEGCLLKVLTAGYTLEGRGRGGRGLGDSSRLGGRKDQDLFSMASCSRFYMPWAGLGEGDTAREQKLEKLGGRGKVRGIEKDELEYEKEKKTSI